jgi:hypothetical protein
LRSPCAGFSLTDRGQPDCSCNRGTAVSLCPPSSSPSSLGLFVPLALAGPCQVQGPISTVSLDVKATAFELQGSVPLADMLFQSVGKLPAAGTLSSFHREAGGSLLPNGGDAGSGGPENERFLKAGLAALRR